MKIITLAMVLTTVAQVALAADAIVPQQEAPMIEAAEAPVAAGARWAGLYVGAGVGQGYLRDSIPAEGNDMVYSGFAGYNKQWGHLVAGLEAAVDKADILFTDGSGIKSRYMYSARVRAGWANDWIFAYGSVGAQQGVTNIPAPYDKDTAMQLGGGLDVAVTKNVSVGLDFTYTKYKKFADFQPVPGLNVDVSTKVVKGRVSYTFN